MSNEQEEEETAQPQPCLIKSTILRALCTSTMEVMRLDAEYKRIAAKYPDSIVLGSAPEDFVAIEFINAQLEMHANFTGHLADIVRKLAE